MKSDSSIRPYWHVDVKWIFGILTVFFLSISLILSISANLLSEKTAIPLATIIVASQFSKDGLDDPKDIEIAKAKFLSTREDVFYPLGDKNIKITRKELETLSPREIRLKIFRQMVEPYYYQGVDGVAEKNAKTIEEKENIKQQAGVLGFLNIKSSQTIQNFFLLSLIPSFLSLIGLVFFSNRYGKLISPAVVFLLVCTIPTIVLFLITHTTPPLDKQGRSEGIPFLPFDVIQDVARALSFPYYVLFFAGVGLIGVMFVVKLFKHFTQKTKLNLLDGNKEK